MSDMSIGARRLSLPTLWYFHIPGVDLKHVETRACRAAGSGLVAMLARLEGDGGSGTVEDGRSGSGGGSGHGWLRVVRKDHGGVDHGPVNLGGLDQLYDVELLDGVV